MLDIEIFEGSPLIDNDSYLDTCFLLYQPSEPLKSNSHDSHRPQLVII